MFLIIKSFIRFMVISWFARLIMGSIVSLVTWFFRPRIVAILTIIPPIFLRLIFGQNLVGLKGVFIKMAIGFGAVLIAAFLSSWCPQLGIILIVFAIIFADFFGVIGVYVIPRFPYIGPFLEPIVAPLSGNLHIIMVLCAALFILQFFSIFSKVPLFGTVISILNIAFPLIIIYLLWGMYVPALEGLSGCFGEGLSLPGLGRVRIGT